MTKFSKLLSALAAGTLLLSACGGSDDSLDDRLDIADPKVRFLHAIPLAPNVSLYRNEVKQADVTNVGYKFASQYFYADQGLSTWAVKTESPVVVAAGSLAFDAKRGNKYTIVALPGVTDIELLLIDDPYNKGIVSDKARVRVVNASFNAANIDVYMTAVGADLAAATPTFAAVGYKTANPPSGSDSIELNGGTYQLRITPAGSKTVIFSKTVMLDNNADWLLSSIAGFGAAAAAVSVDEIKVLVAKADDTSNTATELTTD